MGNYTIKLLSFSDSRKFFESMTNNKNRLEDFFAGTVKHTQTLESTINYCREIELRIEKKEYFPYLIFDKDTLIGFIDFKNIDWSVPKAEIGAFIDHNFEGKGIITQSFKYLLKEVVKKHEFKKLYCRISKDNIRSIKLALGCGFTLEGVMQRDYCTTDGKLIDLNYYGMLI